jgi:hypothetical protein
VRYFINVVYFSTSYNAFLCDFLRGDNVIRIGYLCCWPKEGETFVSPRTVHIYVWLYVCMYSNRFLSVGVRLCQPRVISYLV